MSSVPYIFATSTGNIALSQLDVNFANVKAQVDSANVVSNSAQPAIHSLGALTGLTVNDTVKGDQSLIMLSGGANNETQLQWAEVVTAPNTTEDRYVWVDANGAYIESSGSAGTHQWAFNANGTSNFPGNLAVTGNASVTQNLTVTGNLRVYGLTSIGPFTKSQLLLITGRIGSVVAVIDSPVHAGKLAYWDATFSRWSYVKDDSAI